MKKLVLLTVAFFLTLAPGVSQSLMHDWTITLGTDGYYEQEDSFGIMRDDAGNVYTAGLFSGSEIGPTGMTVSNDIGVYTNLVYSTYLAKSDATGAPQTLVVLGGLEQINDARIIGNTEIVIIGSSIDTLVVDGMGYDIHSYGREVPVRIVMDMDFNITSVDRLYETGYNNDAWLSSAKILDDGSFILYGDLSDTLKLRGSNGPIETDRSTMFISRFNTSANAIWTTTNTYLDPANDPNPSVYFDEMNVDVNGHLWFSGGAYSVGGFNLGGVTVEGSQDYGPILFSMDPSDGAVLWAVKGKGPKDGFVYFSDLMPMADGGMLYMGDLFGAGLELQGTVRSLGNVSHHEGNIVMARFLADGTLDWMRILPIRYSPEFEKKGTSARERKGDDGLGFYKLTQDGDLIIGSQLGADLSIDGLTAEVSSDHPVTGVMLRIDTDHGDVLWANVIYADLIEGADLKVDNTGSIWFAATIIGDITFGGNTSIVTSDNETDRLFFISVFSSDNGFLKATKVLYPDEDATNPYIDIYRVYPDSDGMGALFLGDVVDKYDFDGTVVMQQNTQSRFVSYFNLESVASSQSDSTVLVDFYNANGGDNWKVNRNWKTGSLDTWHGVGVENGRVVSLSLENNDINTVSTLTGLNELAALNLSGNKISDISALELGDLAKLKLLNLSDNSFTAFPVEIFDQTGLEAVKLDRNRIAGSLPATIGTMGDLKTFSARNNEISGALPAELGNLTNLISLDLARNQIEAPLPDLSGMSSLYHLNLNYNLISGSLPDWLSSMSILSSLGLAYNDFTGTLPAVLLEMESLLILDLRGNEFNAFDPETPLNTTLEELYLGKNRFSDTIPSFIGNMFMLKVLDLSNNRFSGRVPENFSLLMPNRVYLNNNLLDSLPDLSEWYGTLLNVQNNNLTFEFLQDLFGVTLLAGPQSPVNDFQFLEYIQGEEYELVATTPGQDNQYQWWKNGRYLGGANNDTLVIPDANPADTGFYYCYVQNANVPGLTLRTRPIVLGTKDLPMAYLLQGRVTDSLGSPVESGYVYLYQDTNKVKSPRMDSVTLQADGYFNFKDFPKGKYMVKMVADKARYPEFWPTYYPGKVSWKEGSLVQVTEDSVLNVDITAVGVPALTSADGSGEVGGNISYEGETKGEKVEPVREATVVLIGKEVAKGDETFTAMVITDDNGNYTIENVPDGDYYMLVDIPGLSMLSTYDVTITGNKITDQDFLITNEGIEAANASGIEQPVFELVDFTIFPNPADDFMKIRTVTAGIQRIEVISILGQKVLDEFSDRGAREATLDVSMLNGGLYFIRLHTDKGLGLKKVIVR